MGKTKKLGFDLRLRIINSYKLGNSDNTISNRLAIPGSKVQFVMKKF